MKWSITQLQKFRNKDLKLNETVQMNEVMELDHTIRAVSPMQVTGRIDVGTDRFTFHLHIKGHLVLPCSRTLLDVHYPIDIKTVETFINQPYMKPSELELEEDVQMVEGNMIDLRPIIHEYLILEIPMQVYSNLENDEDAAPQSGEGWEVIEEKPKDDKIDPRLAKLAKFFDQEDDTEK